MCLSKITTTEPRRKEFIGYKGVNRKIDDELIKDICTIFRRGDVIIYDSDGDRFILKKRMDNDEFTGKWHTKDCVSKEYEQYDLDNFWSYITQMLPTIGKIVTGIQEHPCNIGETYKDKNTGQLYSGKRSYPVGFHVSKTIKGARGYGSRVVKVKLTEIHTVGLQSGDETCVGTKMEVLELVE